MKLALAFLYRDAYMIKSFSGISSAKTIKVITEDYPPYVMNDSNLNYGLMGRIVRGALEEAGIESHLIFMPSARGYKEVQNGNYVATFPWALREERKRDFYYSDPLMESDYQVFFYLKGGKFKWNEGDEYSKLKDYRIGGKIGYNYGEKISKAEKENRFKLARFPETANLFKMLFAGRIDAIIMKKIVGNHRLSIDYSEHEKINDISWVKIEDAKKSYDYLLVSKKHKDAKEFLKTFNAGLKKHKAQREKKGKKNK
jgi:polar amino acid transport system substrate-binding protein